MKSGNAFCSEFTGGIDLGDFKDFAFLLSSAYVVLCRIRQKEVPFFFVKEWIWGLNFWNPSMTI